MCSERFRTVPNASCAMKKATGRNGSERFRTVLRSGTVQNGSERFRTHGASMLNIWNSLFRTVRNGSEHNAGIMFRTVPNGSEHICCNTLVPTCVACSERFRTVPNTWSLTYVLRRLKFTIHSEPMNTHININHRSSEKHTAHIGSKTTTNPFSLATGRLFCPMLARGP